MKYIIDMDIGDDIDDAFALLLAMELKMDIVGITTVFRNTAQRTRIAKKMLKTFGQGYETVPVYAGYGDPIADPNGLRPRLCQYTSDLDASMYDADSLLPADAVDFIIESCRRYGKELTVIAIGPFTNMARVIEKDKDALNMAAELIIMGGCYFKQYTDWNVICDVEAAKVMFENVDRIVGIGSDVTHRLPLTKEDNDIIFGEQKDEIHSYVSQLYQLGKKANPAIGCIHDPLAVYYAYDKSICRCEEAPVAVITEGLARGFTINTKAYKHTMCNPAYKSFDLTKTKTLAREVDEERMMGVFMELWR